MIFKGAEVLELSQRNLEENGIKKETQYDYIIIKHGLGYFTDIPALLKRISFNCRKSTKVIIIHVNFFWRPFLKIAAFLKLIKQRPELREVSFCDLKHALFLNDFEIIKEKPRILFPFYFPVLAPFFNRFLINVPFFRCLAVSKIIIARKINLKNTALQPSCSVIVPCRNEKGNIEAAARRIPDMGSWTEIIFVEGHSRDSTLTQCRRVQEMYPEKNIRVYVQEGRGKGDAVRKGFDSAKGDILMILDADLTVIPEVLPDFFHAIESGKGEFINGSRLIYRMEKKAMRPLNFLANKFFSFAFSYLLGQKITDTLCGTKVLWRSDYQKIVNNRPYFGDFDPFGDFDLLFGAAKLGLKIIDVPVAYRARVYGETQINRFRDGWRLLKMTFFAAKRIKFI